MSSQRFRNKSAHIHIERTTWYYYVNLLFPTCLSCDGDPHVNSGQIVMWHNAGTETTGG